MNIKTIRAKSDELNRVQTNLAEAINVSVTEGASKATKELLPLFPWEKFVFVNVTGAVSGSKFTVKHNLGQVADGTICVKVKSTTACSFFTSPACTDTRASTELVASANFTFARFLVWSS